MGDRCFYSATVRKADLEKFTKIIHGLDSLPQDAKTWEEVWDESSGHHQKAVELSCYEMNYAGYDENQVAAEAGCVFFGHNGAGCEYGDGAFVGIGGKFYEVAADQNGWPIAGVTREGPSEGDLDAIQKYHEAEDEAYDALSIPRPTRHGVTPGARKFYREVIRFEILSEDPIPECLTLGDIQHNVMEGHMSGRFLSTAVSAVVDGKRMATLLIDQGTDPDFFGLDEEGNDIREDE
jgi:hypothetical protein